MYNIVHEPFNIVSQCTSWLTKMNSQVGFAEKLPENHVPLVTMHSKRCSLFWYVHIHWLRVHFFHKLSEALFHCFLVLDIEETWGHPDFSKSWFQYAYIFLVWLQATFLMNSLFIYSGSAWRTILFWSTGNSLSFILTLFLLHYPSHFSSGKQIRHFWILFVWFAYSSLFL